MKPKPKQRLNRHTGQPRKWTCYNYPVDRKLEMAEAEHYYYLMASRLSNMGKNPHAKKTYELMPLQMLEEMVEDIELHLNFLKSVLVKRGIGEGFSQTQRMRFNWFTDASN